jgi:reverse gyrase
MASKYHNVKTTLDGLTFDSKAEAERYAFLKLLQRIGEISDLELQPVFRFEVKGIVVCKYIADFAYRDKRGCLIVEDVKGVRTAAFNIKAKLFRALKGFDISLITKGARA